MFGQDDLGVLLFRGVGPARVLCRGGGREQTEDEGRMDRMGLGDAGSSVRLASRGIQK